MGGASASRPSMPVRSMRNGGDPANPMAMILGSYKQPQQPVRLPNKIGLEQIIGPGGLRPKNPQPRSLNDEQSIAMIKALIGGGIGR